MVILGTALRRGEVLGLTWKDVDIENKILRINHQLHYTCARGKYKFSISSTKTKSGIREIPLTETMIAVFMRLKEEAKPNRISIDGYNDFVFINSKGDNVIIPRQLSDSLTAACEKYNKKERVLAAKEDRVPVLLPPITSHILRHTACTRMAEAGIDVKVLQELLGHKRCEVTMNIYNHVGTLRKQKEVEKLENMLVLA